MYVTTLSKGMKGIATRSLCVLKMQRAVTIHGRLVSRLWMSHVTCINESRHIHDHIRTRPIHIWACVSHSCMRNALSRYMDQSCHVYEWVTSRTWSYPARCVVCAHKDRPFHVPRSIYMSHIWSYMSHIWSYTYMTHSYMSHSLQSLRNRCRIHERDMSHLRDRVVRDMAPWWIWHDSFKYDDRGFKGNEVKRSYINGSCTCMMIWGVFG